MRLFKALLPLIILTAVAFYARQNFALLPKALADAMQFLPMLLFIFVTGVALHFNQARILSYLLMLGSLFIFLDNNWLDSELKYALFASFTPIAILFVMLLKQQGVFTIRALPEFLILLFTLLFALWLIREQPEWIHHFLFTNWLPEKYFDWTELSQSTLIIYCVTVISILILLALRKNSLTVTALGMIAILIMALQFKTRETDLMLLISTGLLLCLITVLQESWRMAYLDELTLLPGRRALREKLQSLLGLYTLVMVDIDLFKKFNDSYGHEIGDEALRTIAAKLNKVTGGGTAYRYGGEEFTLVFANKSKEQVKQYIEELREHIAKSPFVVKRRTNKKTKRGKDKSVTITVSCGIADSIGISTTEETLKKADVALYKAKKKGRNCSSF